MLATVAIPVKDGARYLAEVLDAVLAQRGDFELETVVIDSGSSDGSQRIARRTGVELIEIAPHEFGHGRTRNLAIERSAGEVVAFLTQDATPAGEGWLERLLGCFGLDERVGAAFGPHLPRPGASPMVARELREHFDAMAPEGHRVLQCAGEEAFFSNVNSAVSRRAFEVVRFRDLEYAEDQAFARDLLEAGLCKVYDPGAGVLHSHDYSPAQFRRRYFDEYRGLRRSLGHTEPLRPSILARRVATGVQADREFMRIRGYEPGSRLRWSLESARHHTGRALFAGLGSRSDRLPTALQRRLSLEGSAAEPGLAGELGARPGRSAPRQPYDLIRRESRRPPAPLLPPSPYDGEREQLHVAWVVPPFVRGSGGHGSILQLVRELERRGHTCSIWIDDPRGRWNHSAAVSRRMIRKQFQPIEAPVFCGTEEWFGADVAFATGWQSAWAVRGLDGCRLKAYLVQDYEPDFYPASAERVWAERTYGFGLPCIAASPWLAERLRERHGAEAHAFPLGVDLERYRPGQERIDPDSVAFYVRMFTPRRANELGMLALRDVIERRPGTQVLLFGEADPPAAAFPYRSLGQLSPDQLARLYRSAAVGLSLSLTNYSLTPLEMMACGLPVVELRGSAESVFGEDPDLVAYADPDPVAVADAVLDLLADPQRRERMSERGPAFVAGRTWAAATDAIEATLRDLMGARWKASLPAQ